MRGQAADYDGWRQAGNRRLGLGRRAALLHASRGSLRRARSAVPRRAAARFGSRSSGCAGISSRPSATPPRQYGVPQDRRLQHRRQLGSRFFQVTQRRGWRWSAARCLPAAGAQPRQPAGRDRRAGRPGADRATAARSASAYAAGRPSDRIARARGEVILAAGAIGSPAILERIGIGDGGAAARARHRPAASTCPASAAICRTISRSAAPTASSGVATLNSRAATAGSARR